MDSRQQQVGIVRREQIGDDIDGKLKVGATQASCEAALQQSHMTETVELV